MKVHDHLIIIISYHSYFQSYYQDQSQTIIRMTLPSKHDLLQGSFLFANKQLKGEKNKNGEVDIRKNEKNRSMKNKKRIQRIYFSLKSTLLPLDGEVIFSD